MSPSVATRRQSASPGPPDAATRELVDELQALCCDALGNGLERMFDGADDMLFEMARRATNNKDQRLYFDTMRVVRLGRTNIARIFREEIAAGFSPDAVRANAPEAAPLDFEKLTLQEARALEESIAVSTMAAKAESLYSNLLFELGRRIGWLIREKRAPIASAALSPAAIAGAFRRSAEPLDVEFDIELVIFKLFDRVVFGELGDLYVRVLRFMDAKGVKAAAIAATPDGAPRPGRGAAPADGTTAADGDASAGGATATGALPAAQSYGMAPPTLDPTTLAALRSLAGAMFAPGFYGDAQLGADLAAAAGGQMVPGWDAPRAYAYVQRASVVGHMFNELIHDPTLPAPLKSRFDHLRFSVIKSALHDADFFANQQHPVRGLLSELALLAARARASGMETLRRIEELVGQIQGQFEIAAADVRAQRAMPEPLDDKTLDRFFAQQREDARQRRQAIVERTRRVVAEELQLATVGRRLPDAVWPLLQSGWAPLAALCLLRHGAGSEPWNDSMELLGRILDSVDPRPPLAPDEEALHVLARDLRQRLLGIGMIEARIDALLSGWREALAAREAPAGPADALHPPDAPDAGPAPAQDAVGTTALDADQPAPGADSAAASLPAARSAALVSDATTLLDLLMVLSSWFRVYDDGRSQNRWLKVVSHHPAEGTVTFAEFNGQNPLMLRTDIFLDDLAAGRAEPIDLGPAARRSLEAYLRARREGEAANSADTQAAA